MTFSKEVKKKRISRDTKVPVVPRARRVPPLKCKLLREIRSKLRIIEIESYEARMPARLKRLIWEHRKFPQYFIDDTTQSDYNRYDLDRVARTREEAYNMYMERVEFFLSKKYPHLYRNQSTMTLYQ